jgi:phenylacetate-CoA ligase
MTAARDSLLGRETQPLRSLLTHVAWPAMPSERGATLLALMDQLDASQWWSADELLMHQLQQVERLLRHARSTVPYYRDRYASSESSSTAILTLAAYRRLPTMSRRDIQDAGDALHSRALDPRFGSAFAVHTSGSTGEPVRLLATELDRIFWEALTMRDHDWHRRDFTRRLASIRANVGSSDSVDPLPDWGMPASELCVTGRAYALSSSTDYATQTDWLQRHRPEYLYTYPGNLGGLLDHCERNGIGLPGLLQVRTTGEILDDALRTRCMQQFGASVVDLYSSQECGYLAIECPKSGLYHVMSETVLLEVLGPDDAPCREGEIGEVVVTVLHNFASPLIRYRMGDHAEVGPACPCGRGLPTLRRIRGRSRHLVCLPDGTRHWPLVGFYEYRDVAPIRQYQAIQHDLRRVELRLVADRPLTGDEERRLRGVVQKWLQHPFDIRIVYFDGRIPASPSGKFEDFICLVPQR